MRKLTIDFETRSASDIRKAGAAAYAQHSTTTVLCLALKWSGEEPVIWFPPRFRLPETERLHPITLEEALTMVDEADVVEAHNAQFEWFIWKYVMVPQFGATMLPERKIRCSAAKAAAYGLPRALEQACAALGVAQQKDMVGSKLMLKLSKPRRALLADKARDPDWEKKTYWHEATGTDLLRLGEYCMQDVRAEESLSDSLPDLSPEEQLTWRLDLGINDRGIRVDVPAINSMVKGIALHEERLLKEYKALTGLNSPRQVAATCQWLHDHGVTVEDLTAAEVERALGTVTDPDAKRVLEIRQSLARSSTSKYQAFLSAKGRDNRIRGSLMYYGAATGRWSGRLIQPQNFPRGSFPDVDRAIGFFRKGYLDSVELFYGDVMAAASTCLRGMIVPAEGRDFICADYSSVEGRVLAWLAGEEAALDVYRQGRDPYKVAASAIYHVPYEEVAKPQRQVGKVAELALGYQGAFGAFSAMGANYGISMPEEEVKAIVASWRESRPETVRYWSAMEEAAMNAMNSPGSVFRYRNVRFLYKGNVLMLMLPSRRILYYQFPALDYKDMIWGKRKQVISYMGIDSQTRKWTKQYLYGGKITENITQATARDLLVNGLKAIADTGIYDIVMHVHDEAVAEVDEGKGSVEEYEQLMCQLPPWAAGLPLKAEGWRGKRYKK